MPDKRRDLGRQGEEAAASYLEERGYRVLARNYRCRFGEIDLIAFDGEVLVFVEVRCRTSGRFGLPEESILWRKKARMRKIASHYLKSCLSFPSANPPPVRFDVLALLKEGPSPFRVKHIKNAF
ncbi:MAG: YraN family protein [Desulfotomaculales bacterium]